MFESKRRAFLLLFVSISLGLIAVILFSTYMQETKESMGELVMVQVAGNNIPAGQLITEDLLTEEQIPRKYMLESLIQSPAELVGKVSMVPIAKGAVITSVMLRDNSLVSGEYRQVMLRAPMSVFDDQIDAYDEVDILVSYEQEGGAKEAAADRRTTKVLLKGVTVSSVHKSGDETVAVGVLLKLADTKSLIWALNYGKEVRLLKTGNAKASQETPNTDEPIAADPASAAGSGEPAPSPKPTAKQAAAASAKPAVKPTPPAAVTPPKGGE
ncbi:SAF domain-containing protein [Paenibacillus sp. Soil522]|uniref:SAF domain-containing protein n=1 Tax=Paenibacillus sp. Soil522 TaxID=1736388 RepID=UPI0006F38DBF|nr:SAF domain-containing protein [Paenibacillus sp. Soil522]KRE35414.1 hypothetical protein ASG81_20995 [Paenibacillus sp. Soil522]